MLKGYSVVLAGLILFILLLKYGRFIADGDKEIESLLDSLAFCFLGSGFLVGSIAIAIEKGYSWVMGVLFGIFSPLGLLILTLLPDRVVNSTEVVD